MANIRDKDAFWDGVWDWAMLDGCFGNSNIRPTDLDGFVERNGQFLVLEAKSPNAEIPEGQRRTFEELRRTGLFTIVIVWGPKNRPQSMQVLTKQNDYPYEKADKQTLRNVVAWWYEKVNIN